MYRAILPDGDVECERYEEKTNGVDLYDDADRHVAFVPYASLLALLSEETLASDERSIA